jgi:hypothetical protein
MTEEFNCLCVEYYNKYGIKEVLNLIREEIKDPSNYIKLDSIRSTLVDYLDLVEMQQFNQSIMELICELSIKNINKLLIV